MVPAQADAFYVGLFTSIFRNCTAGKWNPHEVLIRLSDPDAVPPGYHKLMISRGDRRGPSIRFPQQWLLLTMHISELERHSINDVKYPTPPRSFIDAIRQALQPHLDRTDLTAEVAAKLCGYEKRALGRKLKASGSTRRKRLQSFAKSRQLGCLRIPASPLPKFQARLSSATRVFSLGRLRNGPACRLESIASTIAAPPIKEGFCNYLT